MTAPTKSHRSERFNDDGLASQFLNPERSAVMRQRVLLIAAAAAMVAGIASAQYPLIDKLEEKVTQKYKTSTCEQMWQNRGKPQSSEEQKVLDFLKSVLQPDRRSRNEQDVRVRNDPLITRHS